MGPFLAMNSSMNPPSNLSIITFPHPTLRYQAKPLKRVDSLLSEIVARMFELMYEQRGVGLAATQVNLPLQIFVMNPAGRKEEGNEWVFINPVVSRPRGSQIGEEGCLSLPKIYGNVTRAMTVHVSAFGIDGKEIDQDFSEYEARIIQHETDHLHGRLFVDRLTERDASKVREDLEAMQLEFRGRQKLGELGPEDQLLAELSDWVARYC
jgi:peptide deformylase